MINLTNPPNTYSYSHAIIRRQKLYLKAYHSQKPPSSSNIDLVSRPKVFRLSHLRISLWFRLKTILLLTPYSGIINPKSLDLQRQSLNEYINWTGF
jgi:hypothetical protein